MTQRSMFWDGTAGDGGPYDQSHLMDTFFARILGGSGVLYNWRSDLEVTAYDNTSPVTVGTGAAIVYGMFYENDEPVTIEIPTPIDSVRYDRIVVRRDWSAQTVRIIRSAGNRLVRIPGTTYDIPLALVQIDNTGEILVTDARQYTAYATNWANIPSVVTTEKIRNNTIDFTTIASRTRYEYKGMGQIQPDPDNPCAEGVGTYDFWSFSSGAQCWVYFQVPYNYVEGTLEFYLYTSPTVLGAGDVEWNYTIYWGLGTTTGETLLSHTDRITPDQNGRALLTPHRDGLVWMRHNIYAGDIVALQIGRDIWGGLDTYASPMALYGVEMEWTADA